MIGILLSLALAQSAPEMCSVIVPHPEGEGFTHYPVPEYKVETAVPPLSLPEGHPDTVMIVCVRDTLVPVDNDFRVLDDLGVPMMLADDSATVRLELADGRYRYHVVRGELSETLKPAMEAALDRGQQFLAAREQSGTD